MLILSNGVHKACGASMGLPEWGEGEVENLSGEVENLSEEEEV